jgi:DNA topoisomerase I
MGRLRRSDCSEPGIRRVRRGRGFGYAREDGTSVDPQTRSRIEDLVIPPAWTDVWICPEPNGHIQATGYDDAGRKQYLYHERWRANRDRQKFDEMLLFARALPKLRRRVEKDLRLRGLVRERVLAGAVRLLDLGFLRIGSERYAEDNGTYGLATIKKSHVRLERGKIVLDYRGKGDQRDVRVIDDPLLLPTIRALKRRRSGGPELLAYRQGRARWSDVRSDHINAYLKEVTGGEFSAKDFRTWNATVLAAVAVAASENGAGASKASRERVIAAAVRQVASYLGNTPAVCRNSYIDPRVFDRFRGGETIRAAIKVTAGSNGELPENRGAVESAVLRLLA